MRCADSRSSLHTAMRISASTSPAFSSLNAALQAGVSAPAKKRLRVGDLCRHLHAALGLGGGDESVSNAVSGSEHPSTRANDPFLMYIIIST